MWKVKTITVVSPLSVVLFPTVSVTLGQPWSENITWNIPETNDS